MTTAPSLVRPTISVVVPCYNGERFLAEALDSALAQSLAPVEIIVVDDGSTDGSVAVAEKCGGGIRVIRQANKGESTARNLGFSLARGEWLAFLDADDVWDPEKLAESAALVEPSVVCVHTGYYKFGSTFGVVDRSALPPEHRYRPSYVALHNFLLPSTALVRRDVRARFPTFTRHGEDLLFFLELLREGEFRAVPAALTGHRCHRDAQSAAGLRDLRWRGSVQTWLERGGHGLSAEEATAIYVGWDRRAARAARDAVFAGSAEDFRATAEAFLAPGSLLLAILAATAEDVRRMPARTWASLRR